MPAEGVSKYTATDHTSDTASNYKTYIDGNFAALSKVGNDYAPYETSPTTMTIKIAAGRFQTGSTLVENSEQTTGTITAPSSNPRIDLVHIDSTTGTIGVTTGSEAASPSRPSLPTGKIPIAEIWLTTSTTSITNSDITDIRPLNNVSAGILWSDAVDSDVIPDTDSSRDLGSSSKYFAEAYIDTLYTTNDYLPVRYMETGPFKFASTTTYTLGWFACRNSDNDGNIIKNSSTTLTISSLGALNGVAQSANLTGTISASGTTVTGTSTTFTSDYQVGDVIHSVTDGTARRITAIASNTSLTVESSWSITAGTNHRRGGRAPSTHYYVYAINNGTTPGLIMSTRCVSAGDTLTDLPSGYNKSRQTIYNVTTNSSNNLLKMRWSRKTAMYELNIVAQASEVAGTTVLDSGGSTSFADIDMSTYVPKTSRLARLVVSTENPSSVYIREDGETHGGINYRSESNISLSALQSCSSSQKIEYKIDAANANMAVLGFDITEI